MCVCMCDGVCLSVYVCVCECVSLFVCLCNTNDTYESKHFFKVVEEKVPQNLEIIGNAPEFSRDPGSQDHTFLRLRSETISNTFYRVKRQKRS